MNVGGTYDLEGMLIVALKPLLNESGFQVLVLEDNTGFAKRIPPGTTFPLLRASPYWKLCKQIASPEEQGKVDP